MTSRGEMSNWQNKTAVVTGASGGIGGAIAEKAVTLGMNVVLADINRAGLESVQRDLEARGGEALSVETDVSRLADVEALANAAYDRFGAVHLVFNNAGTMTPGSLLKLPFEDMRRMIDTNLWGTLYGMKVFMPRMMADGQGHVVNTSSLNGLLAYPAMGVYNGTKAAIINISETVFHELTARNASVGISVVCPGAVKKKQITGMTGQGSRSADDRISRFREETGIYPAELADVVFEALEHKKFWIFTQKNFHNALTNRVAGMLDESTPVFELPV